MEVTLNILKDNPGARTVRKTVGRGIGSGLGKTSGRGGKGQTARSGVAIKGFEGGQTPIHRRLPKRGFKSPNRVVYQVVNVQDLQKYIDAGSLKATGTINAADLIDARVLKHLRNPIKLLAQGAITKAITIEVDAASVKAIAAVEKAGGKVVLPAPKVFPAKAEKAAKKSK